MFFVGPIHENQIIIFTFMPRAAFGIIILAYLSIDTKFIKFKTNGKYWWLPLV